jgi:hypothetical protein
VLYKIIDSVTNKGEFAFSLKTKNMYLKAEGAEMLLLV